MLDSCYISDTYRKTHKESGNAKFNPAVYQVVVVVNESVTLKENYQVKVVVDPGEYGWTIKSTVRIQKKWNEHTTAPTSAQDMNDALDTMQGVLDFLGFLPLFGSAADAINTAMSILRADYLAAMLNSVGLMGGVYSNVITAPFKMLLAAADNADKFSAALKTFKAAVGIVGDATSYISNMFNTMKSLILNVTSSIGDVTKASAFGLLSKEMKDKLAGFLEMIGTGISKAMTAIEAQVDELMGKVSKAEAVSKVDDVVVAMAKEGIDVPRETIETVLSWTDGNSAYAASILRSSKQAITGKSLGEIVQTLGLKEKPALGTLSNYEARIWYTWQKSLIKSKLDFTQSLEKVARDAVASRNDIRQMARDLMSESDLAKMLDSKEPMATFEGLFDKYSKAPYNLEGE